jgi:hypothetical protein
VSALWSDWVILLFLFYFILCLSKVIEVMLFDGKILVVSRRFCKFFSLIYFQLLRILLDREVRLEEHAHLNLRTWG